MKRKDKIRRVLIGTPIIDGKICVEYFMSFIETLKYFANSNIQIFPFFIAHESIIQFARNDIIQVAVESDIDDLIFIDGDMEWHPTFVEKLLNHNVDLVGGTTRRKSDEESYVVKIKDNNLTPNKNGLIEVSGLGTGFLRMNRKCFSLLYENSEKYVCPKGQNKSMVFDITIKDGKVFSEDISMCNKWRELGGQVWFDPTITCYHIGTKKWTGNFEQWIKNINYNI